MISLERRLDEKRRAGGDFRLHFTTIVCVKVLHARPAALRHPEAVRAGDEMNGRKYGEFYVNCDIT